MTKQQMAFSREIEAAFIASEKAKRNKAREEAKFHLLRAIRLIEALPKEDLPVVEAHIRALPRGWIDKALRAH